FDWIRRVCGYTATAFCRWIACCTSFSYPNTGAFANRERRKSSIPGDMSLRQSYDAIVVGCGPAGAAASAVLASKGRRVVVLEREKFPRYHIGESLIPYTYFPLQRIGMIE